MAEEAWVGMDLGGSKIAGGVVDATGRIAHLEKRATFETHESEAVVSGALVEGDRVLRNLFRGIRSLLSWAGEHGYEVKGISIASPGPVDVEEGVVLNPPNIPFRNLPLRSLCERGFALPVRLEKDTNAAAFGEYLHRTEKVESLLYIAVGTGIGGGFVLRGEVYRGAGGLAMEIGHIVLDPKGPECGCGARGCFEALASGSAMTRAVLEAGLAVSENEGIVEFLGTKALVEPRAKEILGNAALHLAAGVASAMNLLDPDLVVLAGGVISAAAKVGSPLLDLALRGIEERSFRCSSLHQSVPVVTSTLGDTAAILGGVALMRRALGL